MSRPKQVGLLTVFAIVLWAGEASAMYTPNPAGRWEPYRFFLAGDFQFNYKDMDPGGSIDNMVGFFARPTFSIAQNVVLYGMLGVQTADKLDTGFAGGVGLQGAYVLPRAREWAIGGSFQYLHWDSDFSHPNCSPSGRCPAPRSINWDEFQFAPAVSYSIRTAPQLTPYAGMLFDFVDAHASISERNPVGLLFGANFDPSPHVRLDGQFRVISETGLLLSVGYLF